MKEKSENYKLLMFAPSCFPMKSAEAIVNVKLALAMKAANWHVDIVTNSKKGIIYYPFLEFVTISLQVDLQECRRLLELARQALEAGKPVFINRPFTASIADAEEAVRLAWQNDAPLMCASSLEFQAEIPHYILIFEHSTFNIY